MPEGVNDIFPLKPLKIHKKRDYLHFIHTFNLVYKHIYTRGYSQRTRTLVRSCLSALFFELFPAAVFDVVISAHACGFVLYDSVTVLRLSPAFCGDALYYNTARAYARFLQEARRIPFMLRYILEGAMDGK